MKVVSGRMQREPSRLEVEVRELRADTRRFEGALVRVGEAVLRSARPSEFDRQLAEVARVCASRSARFPSADEALLVATVVLAIGAMLLVAFFVVVAALTVLGV